MIFVVSFAIPIVVKLLISLDVIDVSILINIDLCIELIPLGV